MRLFFPLVFVLLFLTWILYRLILKRDLLEHKHTLGLGLFFICVWAALYFLILK